MTEEKAMKDEGREPSLLVDKTEYLTSGVHIGMKTCTKYMKRFIYKTRDDGLSVFNIQKVDERIKTAAKFLAGFENMLVVSRKTNGQRAVEMFAETVKARAIAGRFPPGTLTNPSFREFFEPDVVFVTDPLMDHQAVVEAKKKKIPVVAICDTFNECSDVDLVIPANNNGKKSLALLFWVMAREILKERKELEGDFTLTYRDFGGD